MRSMTGYGRGQASSAGLKATVELSSVNRKQSEIVANLPRELEALDPLIRERLAQAVSRGRVNAKVVCDASDEAGATEVRVNRAAAQAYATEFSQLAQRLGLSGGVTLESVLRAPGVLESGERADAVEKWKPVVLAALDEAILALVRMREREGENLCADLRERMNLMRAAVGRVREVAPAVLTRYRDQLRERIRQAGLPLPLEDDERLLKEIVLFADRSDVSEELARLGSHFQQFEDCVKSRDPVGRTLDFLSQEMHREINTIGSKANDASISREVVVLKTELEKFREQVQNVE